MHENILELCNIGTRKAALLKESVYTSFLFQSVRDSGCGVATGEACQNRVMFKQFLMSGAMQFCQVTHHNKIINSFSILQSFKYESSACIVKHILPSQVGRVQNKVQVQKVTTIILWLIFKLSLGDSLDTVVYNSVLNYSTNCIGDYFFSQKSFSFSLI